MRKDSFGLFWQDEAKVRAPAKEKIKRTPPERFWESIDYLPGLEEALAFHPDLFTDYELAQAAKHQEKLLFDIEIYPNYALFAFKSYSSGKVIYFEMDDNTNLDAQKFRWVLENFCLINFNGRAYDFPICAIALEGWATDDLWVATREIIEFGTRPSDVLKRFKTKKLAVNQIDLIELTALGPGLKVCAGRLHAKRMQDLPFKPGTYLSPNQIAILRPYCINDLNNTGLLYKSTLPQIEIREVEGQRFGVDLRSHSDAQMAEAIINSEIKRITKRKYIARTQLPPGTFYHYKAPSFVKYSSPLMQHVLQLVTNCRFDISLADGSVVMPEELSKLVINIAKGSYKLGVGGLHSQEKSVAHIANDEYFIADTDATSYYPKLILNAGLTPENLGKDFIIVFNGIVSQRIAAKAAGNALVAECLKIVVNGTFGKLGSWYSIMYAPNLLIQVTISGQLAILMLVERFELAGIEVTSVNTDGIVVKCLRSKEDVFKGIVKQWEKETGIGTEETRYKATFSKDINNYFAIYEKPEKGKWFKTKGQYGETAPKKNAVNEICITAIKDYMSMGIPVDHTIRSCRKINMFTTMRSVSGGAVKGDVYLGKVIRWYYATGEQGEIIYAKTGNKVAHTDGAKPCMDLPEEFPDDVNYQWYVDETYKILEDIGYASRSITV